MHRNKNRNHHAKSRSNDSGGRASFPGKKNHRPKKSGNAGNGTPANNNAIEFGMIVAKGCTPEELKSFFDDFSYELIDDNQLPGRVDERVVAEKYSGASALTILRHSHVDLELIEDEWTSFSRVGTPVNLFYVELMSPLPASPDVMRVGKEYQFAINQPA